MARIGHKDGVIYNKMTGLQPYWTRNCPIWLIFVHLSLKMRGVPFWGLPPFWHAKRLALRYGAELTLHSYSWGLNLLSLNERTRDVAMELAKELLTSTDAEVFKNIMTYLGMGGEQRNEIEKNRPALGLLHRSDYHLGRLRQ